MSYLKVSDFHTLKNYKKSCINDRDISCCLFATGSKNAAILVLFSHSAQILASSLKNSANLPVQKIPSWH
jgi:hypothetical protein